MKITAGEIKQLISYLNFIPEDGQDNIYFKKYENHNDYIIRIDYIGITASLKNKALLGETLLQATLKIQKTLWF